MRKESPLFSVLRLLAVAGCFALLLMLYWSSLLIEESLVRMQTAFSDMRTDLQYMQRQLEKAPLQHTNAATSPAARSQIRNDLPNLLEEDKFYTTTLPKLLGSNFKPKGTFRTAELARPANVHPFNNLMPAPEFVALTSDAIAHEAFGKSNILTPGLAIKMEERINDKTGIPEYWVHLRDHVYWQPLRQEFFGTSPEIAPFFKERHQVTAEDFKFYLDAIKNPFVQESGAVALRVIMENLEEIEVVDPLTFIVRWKSQEVETVDGVRPRLQFISKLLTGGLRPLASFVYKYFPNGKKIIPNDSAEDTYRANSLWAQNFNEHWSQHVLIACGAWHFESLTDKQLTLVRNPDYYEPLAALTNAMTVEFKDVPDNILQSFKIDQIDTYDKVPPDKIAEVEDFLKTAKYKEQLALGNGIDSITYVAKSFYFVAWNQANPLFQSAKVRRALSLAIDRKRIIEQFYNGMGVQIHGPFYVFSKENDPNLQPWPFDPLHAKQLLAEEGFADLDGNGVLEKEIDGVRTPFRFNLTYYVKYPLTRAVAGFIASSLKEVGIQCDLNGVDTADFSATVEDKSFDAIWMAWVNTSFPDLRQLWSSSTAKEKGSSNIVGIQNPELDRIINALDYEFDREKRLELYHAFDRIIHEEEPYTFVYTPKFPLFFRNRVKNVFIPAERQDLVPGADEGVPVSGIFYLEDTEQAL